MKHYLIQENDEGYYLKYLIVSEFNPSEIIQYIDEYGQLFSIAMTVSYDGTFRWNHTKNIDGDSVMKLVGVYSSKQLKEAEKNGVEFFKPILGGLLTQDEKNIKDIIE